MSQQAQRPAGFLFFLWPLVSGLWPLVYKFLITASANWLVFNSFAPSIRRAVDEARVLRALDLLVTHAPPRGVNDRPDPAHRGFETLRGFLEQWKPPYQVHGHIHLYDRSLPYQQRFADTDVINVFPYRILELEPARAPAEPAVEVTS